MATAIRLKKTGRKHDPSYRIVVMDSRKKRDGRETEVLGWYDPLVRDAEKQASIDRERVKYWLSVGAQPTDTVRGLLTRLKVL